MNQGAGERCEGGESSCGGGVRRLRTKSPSNKSKTDAGSHKDERNLCPARVHLL